MFRTVRHIGIPGKLLLCLLAGILPVVVLYVHSEDFHRHKNSFKRVFPSHVILQTHSLDIEGFDDYIIGNAANVIYLGRYKNPSFVFLVKMNLRDTQSIFLKFPDIDKYDPALLIVTIDSPNIFITDKLRTTVFRSSISPGSSFSKIKDFKFSSSESVPLSPESMVLRTFQENIKNNILAKVNYQHISFIDSANALEKQVDGFFCTDGSLQIDHQSNRLLYMYYYRNQFILMDTNLRVIYRAKTLDSNTRSKIQVRTIHNQTILAAPPLIVNKLTCISGNTILIISALRADNEDGNDFKNNIVVDLYDSRDGRYRFSFYLPRINNSSIGSIALQVNQLITIQGHLLVRYDLDL